MCIPSLIVSALGGQPAPHECRDLGHSHNLGHGHSQGPVPVRDEMAERAGAGRGGPGRGGPSRRQALRALMAGAAGVAAATATASAAPAQAAPSQAVPPPSRARVAAQQLRRQQLDNLAGGRLVDLTHPLSADFPVFRFYVRQPEQRQVMFEDIVGFNTAEWTFNEHAGTHIDVPAHSDATLATADQIPLEDLIVPLAVVRIAERAERDNTTEVTVDDLRQWERRNGRIPERAFVAQDSGWYRRVNDPDAYLQFDREAQVLRFPGFSIEAAEFLINERSIVGFGTDTTSLETGTRAQPIVHRMLLTTGRYGLENLAALDEVPESGATLVIGLPKLRNGFGSPVRAFAIV